MYRVNPEVQVGDMVRFDVKESSDHPVWRFKKYIERVIWRDDYLIKTTGGHTISAIIAWKQRAPVLFGEDLLD